MKKILLKILCGALALVMLMGLTACSGDEWKAGELKNGGEVVSDGGFVAETENYLYYINGVATSTEDNAFGKPLKGALMAVDKSDLTKTEVVVPKLFAATDYNAGLFISGGYVYYGTPSTEVQLSGSIASSELMFTRTKLDGSGSTEELFAVAGLSTEYRFIEKDGNVYIVYYDSAETALISYSVNDKAKTVIAKTDAKTDKMLSLGTYKFLSDADKNSAVVVYTVTVYTEAYDAVKAAKEGYARATASYNKVYAYKIGDTVSDAGVAGTCILDGAHNADSDVDDGTFAFTLVKGGYVFFTETVGSKVKTYALTAAQIANGSAATEIINTDYAADANVIVSLNEVYILDTGKVYKADMLAVGKDNQKVCVAIGSGITTLLTVKDNTLYYYNASTQLSKIELNNEDAKEIRISEDTVNFSWYKPEFIKIGEIEYLFYLDNSSLGASYVKYVDLGAPVVPEDTDDNGEDDLFYLDTEKIKLMGIMKNADAVSVLTARINAVTSSLKDGNIVFEKNEETNKLVAPEVEKANALYTNASPEAKAELSQAVIDTLNDYLKAIEIVNYYARLEGIQNCLTAEDAKDFRTAYDEIKTAVETFKASEGASAVDAYIANNYKFYYQKAVSLFEAK